MYAVSAKESSIRNIECRGFLSNAIDAIHVVWVLCTKLFEEPARITLRGICTTVVVGTDLLSVMLTSRLVRAACSSQMATHVRAFILQVLDLIHVVVLISTVPSSDRALLILVAMAFHFFLK